MAGLTGVRNVRNDIEISYDADPVDVDLHVQEALDRSALVPDDSDVQVDTKGSIITLTGHVRTWAEHDAVVGAAWMASGVIDVRDDLAHHRLTPESRAVAVLTWRLSRSADTPPDARAGRASPQQGTGDARQRDGSCPGCRRGELVSALICSFVLLDPDAGALASWSRWRSSGLAIFPTAFFGSISSMYTSRGTL